MKTVLSFFIMAFIVAAGVVYFDNKDNPPVISRLPAEVTPAPTQPAGRTVCHTSTDKYGITTRGDTTTVCRYVPSRKIAPCAEKSSTPVPPTGRFVLDVPCAKKQYNR